MELIAEILSSNLWDLDIKVKKKKIKLTNLQHTINLPFKRTTIGTNIEYH